MNFEYTFLEHGDPTVTEKILRSLPDWFGIEEATKAYISESKKLPMFVALLDQAPIGFLSLKKHGQFSCEVYVMGVMPTFHHKNVGKELIKQSEEYLSKQGFEFLQVKTLDKSRESEFYRKTRLFYQSMGFKKLEVFPTLWDETNPCLLLVKSI